MSEPRHAPIESGFDWWLERYFRVVEMSGVLAILKVVLEPAYPDVALSIAVVGATFVGWYAARPFERFVPPTPWRQPSDPRWWPSITAIFKGTGFMVGFALAVGTILKLAEAIAAYTAPN